MKKYGLNLQYNINYFVNDENRLLVSENVSPILFDDYIFEKIEFSERKFDVGDTADEYRKKSSNLYDSLKDVKKHII